MGGTCYRCGETNIDPRRYYHGTKKFDASVLTVLDALESAFGELGEVNTPGTIGFCRCCANKLKTLHRV